jgi:hypothetical protein
MSRRKTYERREQGDASRAALNEKWVVGDQ